MKYKIIQSVKTKNVITVKIQNKDGIFTGKAKCHPEDVEKGRFSSFAGERYAEIRAILKWIKYRNKIIKTKKESISNLLNDIKERNNNLDSNNPIIKRFFIKMKDYDNQLKENEKTYEGFKNMITKMDKERDDILNKYQKMVNLL